MSIRGAVVTETEINIAATTDDNYAVSDLLGQLASYRKLIKHPPTRIPIFGCNDKRVTIFFALISCTTKQSCFDTQGIPVKRERSIFIPFSKLNS